MSDGLRKTSERIGRELGERIRSLLTRLPEDARQVVALRELEGLSFAEIGKRLALSENDVQLLHARALRRLGELLGDPRFGLPRNAAPNNE